MRLLQIENLFFVKYILKQKKGAPSAPAQASPHKPDVFADESSLPSKRNVLQDVKFDRNTSQLNTVGIDGSLMTVQLSIDILALKMFALLMCQGSLDEKAAIFFDIIVGIEGLEIEKNAISWQNKRLVAGMKKMLFYAEIFPKKYQPDFVDDLMKIQHKNISVKKSRANKDGSNLDFNYRAHMGSQPGTANRGQTRSKPVSMLEARKNQIYWSDEYIILAEDQFEEAFKEVYEESIIDFIFPTHESMVTKEDFVSAIAGENGEKPMIDWLFTTSRLRTLFQEQVNIADLEASFY